MKIKLQIPLQAEKGMQKFGLSSFSTETIRKLFHISDKIKINIVFCLVIDRKKKYCRILIPLKIFLNKTQSFL